MEYPTFLSHSTDRRHLHLLPGGRPQRRADASPAARTCPRPRACSSRSSPVCPIAITWSRPTTRDSDTATGRIPKKFAYTFDHYAEIMNHFTEALGLSRYTLYMQDYGGPVGFRMALGPSGTVEALIVQDAVSHNEGLGANWKHATRFWADRVANESTLRKISSRWQTTRTRHVGNDPNVERYDPDLWTDEFAFLNPARPGRHSKRSLLRLPHQRRRLPQVAGMDARDSSRACW